MNRSTYRDRVVGCWAMWHNIWVNHRSFSKHLHHMLFHFLSLQCIRRHPSFLLQTSECLNLNKVRKCYFDLLTMLKLITRSCVICVNDMRSGLDGKGCPFFRSKFSCNLTCRFNNSFDAVQALIRLKVLFQSILSFQFKMFSFKLLLS